MRALPFVAGAGLLAACSFALLQLRAPAASAAPIVAAPRPVEPAVVPAVRPPPPGEMRQQIRRAVEAAAPSLHTQPDVQRYLADLEARARRNHQITALEVEPGFAAIRELAGQVEPQRVVEMQAEFSQRMNRLAAEQAQ